jgi:Bacterial Ig domain
VSCNSYQKDGVAQTPITVTADSMGCVLLSGWSAGSYSQIMITHPVLCATGSNILGPIVLIDPTPPTAPIVGMITQPTCTTPTGSVALSGLPATGSWTLTRSPGGTTYTGSGTSYTVTGLPTGDTYTFTVTNVDNCTSPASDNIGINLVAGAPVLGGAREVCVGSMTSVTPDTGGTWASDNTGIAMITDAGVVTGVSAGNVTLTYTRTSDGCGNSVSFTVYANPTAPIVGTITQPTCIVPTGSVVLSGLPAPGSWTLTRNPGGTTYTGSGTSYTATGLPVGDTYTFTVTNADNCTSPASANVLISAVPGAPVLGGAAEVCVGRMTTVTPDTGGTWASDNTGIAMITNAGVVTGVSAGTVTLTYTLLSTGCSASWFMNVVNCPTFNPDFGVTYINVALTGDVSTNDIETPGSTYGNPTDNPSNPSPCMPVISSNGSYTFLCGTVGVYEFYVPVCEPAPNQSNCTPVLLQITVLPLNDPTVGPIANPDYVTTLQNVSVPIPVRDNDKCQNGPTCTLGIPTVLTLPLHGSYNPSTGVYTPALNYVGVDSFLYRVCDNNLVSKCAEAWAYITIEQTGFPNITNAMDDYAQTPFNTPISGNAKTNDSDPEGNIQTVIAQNTTIPGKGNLVLASTGVFIFTPVSGFYGPVEFVYTTCDNGTPQACAMATIHILVQPVLCVTHSLKVLLEGPYIDNGSNGITMTTKLNSLGYLPGQKPTTFFGKATPASQPYSAAPWNYNGAEGAGYNHTPGVPATYKANYPSTVTDWVLVSLRENSTSTSTICTKAALLHNNGTVEMINGFDCCDLDLTKTYYVVVEHRKR